MRYNKKIGLLTIGVFAATFLFIWSKAASQEYSVESPDGNLELKVSIADDVKYEILRDGKPLILPSSISIALADGVTLGRNATVASTETVTVNETITPLNSKNKEISDHYNETRIRFTEAYSLILRAYNEGVAYRFEMAFDEDVIVQSEEASFNFAGDPTVIFPEADGAMYSWERAYQTYNSISEIPAAKFCITPAMFSYPDQGIRVIIAESDLTDYPGMYLQPDGGTSVHGKWAHYPKKVTEPDNVYAYHRVVEREDFLAKTSGVRSYPWRVAIVSTDDKDLLNNQLIYKLASPSVLTNTDWINPGLSAWEWWHDAILETDAIPSGTANLNFNLYKYYVDFAAEYGLEYLTMDAGWSADFAGQVCEYAASKDVKVFLWDFINLPVVNPERLTQIKNLGAVGVKIDLIERDDQVAINWLEQLAKDCAERELMVIFHGCPKPTGLERKYPNIINYEAVRGAECAKWDETPNPDYHLQFPFIRMLAGPLDYTPGSMRNVHREEFKPVPVGIPMTMGTKAHELAMYVIFDQPLGYLCDSPTEYRKNKIAMNFLSKVPTVWDETVPLGAEVGSYAVVAKRHGEEWFVGAMTNGQAREIEIDFSFLPASASYQVEIYRDNEQTNADAKAMSYETGSVDHNTKRTFKLAAGGGVAVRVGGIVTGIGENNQKSEIQVFPNPAKEQLYVSSNEMIQSISIVDLMGKVYSFEYMKGSTLSSKINIDMLPEGMYIAKVITASKQVISRFVKAD